MADARYEILIGAEMTGTETISELDALVEKLGVGGKKSDDFQAAIKRVTADLDAAKAASLEAAAALAAGNERYRELERVAVRAAKAVETAQMRGRFDPRAARAAYEAQAALDAYAGTLRTLEANSAAATAKQSRLAKQLANLNKLGTHADARFQAINQRLEKLGAVVGRLPGPLGSIGQKLIGTAKAGNELSGAFGGLSLRTVLLVGGLALGITVVAALGVAFAVATVAVVGFAIAQADAARSAALSRDAFAALSAETAAGVGAFSAIAQETGLADAELVSLTKQLRAAEVSAADMPKALRAAALAERALGSGGAGEFIAQIREGERSVEDFAKTAEDSFGGIVAEQMRGLDAQGKRLGKLWGKLFDGINLDPILDAVAVLVGMLDQANPLAQALGFAFTKAFDIIGPAALSAAYAVEAFALDAAIAAVKAYLFFKEHGDKIGAVLTGIGIAALLFGAVWLAMNASVLVGLAAQVVAWGAMAIAAASAWLAAAAPVLLVIAAIAAVGVAIGMLIYYWDDVVEGVQLIWSDLTAWLGEQVQWFTDLGANLMAGLVAGITGAVSSVINAVSSAVTGAIDAAKSVLGIASPSKVFVEIGGYTAEGFSSGVDAGATEAQGSMAALVTPTPEVVQAAGSAGAVAGEGAAPAGRSRPALDLSGATITFNGVKDAETHGKSMLLEAFTAFLEGDADAVGGAEVPA